MGESNRRVRVVQVISNLEFGGAQRQVIEIANHMDADAFDVHVCCLSDYVPLAEHLKDADRRLHIIQKRFKFDVSTIPRLARLLRRLEADVVHGYLFDAQIAARVAGRLAGTPLVIGSERNTDYRMKRRHLLAYRLTRGCVDLMIANSNAGAAFNQRVLGHPESIYRVIHNGVDTDRFRPRDAADVRHELGFQQDDIVVGMFASFKQQKNHPLFLRAAARVMKRFPKLRLLFVGDELAAGLQNSDAYRQEVDETVDRLDLRKNCTFAGNRRDPERLYTACDFTVLSSYREGTPNVLLESMACGVPVVATCAADNAYVVPDGRAGFIVPLHGETELAERMEKMVADRELRERIGRDARQWVMEEFSLDRLASKVADAYCSALEAKRAGAGVSVASG